MHGEPPRPAPPPQAVNRPGPEPQRPTYAPPARKPAEARAWHSQGGYRGPGNWQPHATWSDHRSANWQTDHRSWQQRGGYGGRYIPADRFRTRFGGDHAFRLHARPSIYEGYPRFSYGGYSFLIVDPWPSVWGDDWYDRDDLYVDYEGDGYYLHDARDPGLGVAVEILP